MFIKVFHDSVCCALSYPNCTEPTYNLYLDEQKALRDLRHREDLVIRPADKGSAIVIQDSDAYNREIARQLSDNKYYRPL